MKNILIIIFLILAGCTNEKHEEGHEFESINQPDLKFDLVFPAELWEYVKKSAPASLNTEKSPYELFEALPIHVKLIEKRRGILNNKNYRFEYSDFGGEVDWNAYLNRAENGAFKAEFEFPKMSEDGDMKVLFLSWSMQSQRDDSVAGNGCGVFYDLTSYFKNDVFKKGLLLHTNNMRYIDLTAGRFYFVNYIKDKIQIAQVTFTDTSVKHLLCKNRI